MSVLNDMTKGIMQTKADKASKLTPVAGESAMSVAQAAVALLGIPEIPQVFLTNEAVRDVAADLRRQAALLISVADGLDIMTALSTVPQPDRSADVEQTKVVERAADERAARVETPQAEEFAARMKRLSASAQAAAFAAADDDGTAEPVAPVTAAPVPGGGWACPDHGTQDLIPTVSRKKREYTMCGVEGCERFEK